MNRKLKKKHWLDYQSQKKAKKKIKKKTHSISTNTNVSINNGVLSGYYRAVAPKCFSFFNNTEDTIKFFKDII